VSLKNCDRVGVPNILNTRPEITTMPPERKREDMVTTWITQKCRSDNTIDIGRSPLLKTNKCSIIGYLDG
jgi:hypothetical protein